MDNQSLKTSTWQRVVVVIVAVLLLLSTVLTYMFIVMSNGSDKTSSNDTDTLINELTAQYDEKYAELEAASAPLSDKYFEGFKGYLSNVKAYNAANANSAILASEDLKVGTGKTLEEGDTDYLAYYLGWCADGEIFDSSFNNSEDPAESTGLKTPLDPSVGLIEGWNQGVVGMKLGGVRQLTISGELAYGDTQEICGEYGAPLKFIILAIEKDETISKLSDELNDIYMQIYMAYYGLSL